MHIQGVFKKTAYKKLGNFFVASFFNIFKILQCKMKKTCQISIKQNWIKIYICKPRVRTFAALIS